MEPNPRYSVGERPASIPSSSFDFSKYMAVYYQGIYRGVLQIALDNPKEPLVIKGVGIVERNDPKLEIKTKFEAASIEDILNAA